MSKIGLAKLAAINLVIFGLLAVALEIGARLAFPEFIGHTHSANRTQGVEYSQRLWNGILVRFPSADSEVDLTKKLSVVLGDSISNGYGTPYEDIFWVKAGRLESLMLPDPHSWLALAGYGNNLVDSVATLDKITKSNIRIGRIVYQFNFNDLMPYTRSDLQNIPAEGMAGTSWFRTLALWRYEYLNHSTFLRVSQHYGGMLARKRSGSCEQRGMDALGPYTWTFGGRPFKTEAEAAWKDFETRLGQVKVLADRIGANFVVFISPLVFDVDKTGRHPHYNHTALDFGCATIEPRARLVEISRRLGIEMVDPTISMRTGFESRLREGNFQPFFFTADENHFTPVAANYAGEALFNAVFALDQRLTKTK
jgi:hypothetical protein